MVVILLSLLAVFSHVPNAQAETYSWGVRKYGSTHSDKFYYFPPDGRFSTPEAAIAYSASVNPDRIIDNVRRISDTVWRFRSRDPNQSFGYEADAYLGGDSCLEDDAVFNPLTGSCEVPDQCADTENVTLFHMFRSGVTRSNAYDAWPSGGEIETPVTVCASGCRYSGANYTGDIPCAAARDGDPLVQYCIAGFLGMGTQCQESDAPYQATTSQPSESPGESGEGDPAPEPVEPDPSSPEYACNLVPGYQWSGSTCSPVFETGTPDGDPNQPDPGSPGGVAGDGSGGSGTGGTTVTIENPDGTTTTVTTGGGSQAENPNNVLGTECAQTLQCAGDAYECALLYQTKKARCDMEEALDFEAQRPQIEALLQGEEYTLNEDEIDIPSFIGEGARFLPSTCPAPISIPLSGHTYSFDTAPFCSFASELGNLIVAFATLAAALYVGRAFGGE